uniref:Uncharacterized protein n=1 Tax=Aegilops tauschii subsp. strangulata TaxID=200361 RepID=A0A452ZFY7_AEGTS
ARRSPHLRLATHVVHGVSAEEGCIHGRQQEQDDGSSAAGDRGQEDATSGSCPMGQRVGALHRQRLRLLLRRGLCNRLRTRPFPRRLQPGKDRRVAWCTVASPNLPDSPAFSINFFCPPQSSFFLRCDQLTDAAEAVVNALGTGMLCCAALQAAAAVLALRLRCRRRSLAYLALALTIGGHCIYAAIAHLLLVADPGDLFFGISFAVSIVFFAAGDIISFVSLLRGGEDEE